MEKLRAIEYVNGIISDVEFTEHIRVSDEVYERVYDIVDDYSFGQNAHLHGTTRELMLEQVIYDIIEEVDGIKL